MGYADGYYYGQGRIICDTSTFSVGDTIRVRSMTDSSKVWNQQVATVGTALVFTVPCYDYYKICTVQTINDTPTEIGGVYKTVDYGQTLFINVLDKTTLGGIQGILNAHQETLLLNIGDEVDITVNNDSWKMQIAGINVYNSHEVIFVSKYIYAFIPKNGNNYATNDLRTKVQEFYANIGSKDKQYIKQVSRKCYVSGGEVTYDDYCYILGNKETANVTSYNKVASQSQMPLFLTQSNRVKSYNGNNTGWWTSDWANNSDFIIITNAGAGSLASSSTFGVVPAFTLLADS